MALHLPVKSKINNVPLFNLRAADGAGVALVGADLAHLQVPARKEGHPRPRLQANHAPPVGPARPAAAAAPGAAHEAQRRRSCLKKEVAAAAAASPVAVVAGTSAAFVAAPSAAPAFSAVADIGAVAAERREPIVALKRRQAMCVCVSVKVAAAK
jgi:hypothetical protein